MDKLKMLFGSRKFWAALVGLAMIIVKAYLPNFPLGEDQVTNLVYVIIAYILGVAVEDGLAARKAAPVAINQGRG